MNTQHRGAEWMAGCLLTGIVFSLGGCGGGDGGGHIGGTPVGGYPMAPTPTPAPAPYPTPSPSPAPAPVPTPAPAPMPSSVYQATGLVSDNGTTIQTDSNLVNAWGLAFNPNAYVWVADNGTSKSTLYDGNGIAQSLVVSIPAGQTGEGSPTGIIYNPTTDFKITEGVKTDTSAFIFAGEDGTISGWSPTVNMNSAVIAVDGSGQSKSYKGLALGSYMNVNYIYVTDFHNNAIDVFNGSFSKTSLPGMFADPALPAGYAPYGIQNIGGNLYVSYAQQDAQAVDEVKGAGLGLIDVFDTGGNFVKRFATGGPLNAPWGMAMAPVNFGSFSSNILVANFGDGTINAFNPDTGQFVGALVKTDGTPIVIDGLWGIAFGNGINSQPMNTLFYTAGPADEAHGLYGRIDAL